MQKLLRHFHDLSLARKMGLCFSALLLVLVLIMLAALNISFGIYDQNLYANSLQSLEFFARQVDDELEEVENFTYELAVSTELQQRLSDLQTLPFDSSAYDYARYQLRVQLIQEVRTHPIVKNIRFIDTNGSEMLVGTDTGRLHTTPLLETLHDAQGGYRLFSPTAEYPYLVGGRDIRKHTDYSMDYLGSCLVTCDAASVIQRQLKAMTSSPGVLYVTAGETMVYRGAKAPPPAVDSPQGYRVWKEEGQIYFVCWMTDTVTGWLYLNLIPYNQIFGQTMALRYILLGIFLALFLLGWLFLGRLARLITRPLERLSASMQVVESADFEAALAMLPDHPYRDETGQLTGEFRVMVVPQYIILRALHLNNTLSALVLPWCFGNAFFVFLIVQYMRGIPRELDEAAMIDGCGKVGILFRVLVPVVQPAIVSAAIFAFYWVWQDFFQPLIFVGSPENFTIPLALNMYTDPNSFNNYGGLFAMSVISLIPVILVFIFFQKYLVEGIATQGIKG